MKLFFSRVVSEVWLKLFIVSVLWCLNGCVVLIVCRWLSNWLRWQSWLRLFGLGVCLLCCGNRVKWKLENVNRFLLLCDSGVIIGILYFVSLVEKVCFLWIVVLFQWFGWQNLVISGLLFSMLIWYMWFLQLLSVSICVLLRQLRFFMVFRMRLGVSWLKGWGMMGYLRFERFLVYVSWCGLVGLQWCVEQDLGWIEGGDYFLVFFQFQVGQVFVGQQCVEGKIVVQGDVYFVGIGFGCEDFFQGVV